MQSLPYFVQIIRTKPWRIWDQAHSAADPQRSQAHWESSLEAGRHVNRPNRVDLEVNADNGLVTLTLFTIHGQFANSARAGRVGSLMYNSAHSPWFTSIPPLSITNVIRKISRQWLLSRSKKDPGSNSGPL